MRTELIALAFGLAVLGFAGAAAPSPGTGKELFDKRCAGCHALDRDKEGPRLGGVYGRVSGSVPGFPYSRALKNAKVTWSDATLDRWLTDTEQVAPDNDMAFRVASAGERQAIIQYLRQNSGN